MSNRILSAAAALALAACSPAATSLPPEALPAPTEPTEQLVIRGTNMVIDRPTAWREGGFRGGSSLHSYIGASHGYPSFTVDWDPEPMSAGIGSSSTTDLIEELHELLTPDHDVEYARWTEINGLDVYSTALTYSSVAGLIRVRRLLLAYEGRPFLISWTAPAEEFAAIETIVEWCVQSLELGAAEPAVAL